MLFDRKASEIPQFVVVLAIAIVLGAAAVWGILSNIGSQGNGVATWIDSIAVPAAHPSSDLGNTHPVVGCADHRMSGEECSCYTIVMDRVSWNTS